MWDRLDIVLSDRVGLRKYSWSRESLAHFMSGSSSVYRSHYGAADLGKQMNGEGV